MAHSITITPSDYIKLVERCGFLTVEYRSNLNTMKRVSYWSDHLWRMLTGSRIGYFKTFLCDPEIFELTFRSLTFQKGLIRHKIIPIANSDYITVQW